MKLRLTLYIFLCLALLVGLVGAASAAPSATITVNSTADNLTSGDGFCTLREAINNANTNVDTTGGDCATGSNILFDTINFAGILTLPNTITLVGALPIINSNGNLTISGPGADQLTVDANGSSASPRRAFEVASGATVTISGLAITGAYLTGTDSGGGIRSVGDLTVDGCAIYGNRAAYGGGIHVALNSTGNLTVRNSTINDNQAECSICDGGGIDFLATAGRTLTVENTTISGNSADDDGGGIHTYSSPSTIAIVRNSTITGNNAGLWDGSGTGGGVNLALNTSSLYNTIVANNPTGGDCGPVITTSVANFFGDATCDGTADGSPMLDALADNGGPTQTHFPQKNSPVLDQGNDTNCLTTDQRGDSRPVDLSDTFYPNGSGGSCDIGAVEVQSIGPLAVELAQFQANSPMTSAVLLAALLVLLLLGGWGVKRVRG